MCQSALSIRFKNAENLCKALLQEDDEESQSNPKQDRLEFSGHRLITSQQQDSAAFDRIVALAMDQNKEQS